MRVSGAQALDGSIVDRSVRSPNLIHVAEGPERQPPHPRHWCSAERCRASTRGRDPTRARRQTCDWHPAARRAVHGPHNASMMALMVRVEPPFLPIHLPWGIGGHLQPARPRTPTASSENGAQWVARRRRHSSASSTMRRARLDDRAVSLRAAPRQRIADLREPSVMSVEGLGPRALPAPHRLRVGGAGGRFPDRAQAHGLPPALPPSREGPELVTDAGDDPRVSRHGHRPGAPGPRADCPACGATRTPPSGLRGGPVLRAGATQSRSSGCRRRPAMR
jgi:hypothetical protein